MTDNAQRRPERFGAVLGLAPGGVPVFSSDYDSADEDQFPDRHAYRSYIDDVYMGQKWQCVEFARRWLYVNRGCVFDDVAMAYDIFRLSSLRVVSDGGRLPLYAFQNGSVRRPEPGALLVWNEGGHFTTTGHVAVVTEIADGHVRIAEQNFLHHAWEDGRTYSRELTMTVSGSGEHRIDGGEDAEILGWVMQTADGSFAESIAETDPALFNLELRELSPDPQAGEIWLDASVPEEAAYLDSMDGHRMTESPDERFKYFCLSESALAELKRATTELHALFLAATEHVLRHDALFAKFNIPKAIWPRIRHSWNKRRNETITGRFDFAVSERGIRVYEYNCDSASCHLEAARVQGKWAAHYGCADGYDSGRLLEERLVNVWRRARVDGAIHIMCDSESEETYHALYMKRIIEAAGLTTRMLRGIKGLDWAADGSVLDPDGTPIRWVWKTWAWETALDQIREECEQDDVAPETFEPGRTREHPPRLVDVLLRREVMVFEPLWTLIPSNKAILPVLWRICPNHRNLLRSAFELREELIETGYAVKPIVGRGGSNITLVDRQSNVISETGGAFEGRDQIFQQMWRLPEIGGLRTQVCTFTAGNAYGGSCIRADRAVVISADSDCYPLRIVPDRALAR